ncbi:hypothetical protein [Streptomyces avermitilis]|uniref:hypothetical protein n=1 Tax=Streptomyces avermitilis TaxID=33903 RepID=UPI003806F61D
MPETGRSATSTSARVLNPSQTNPRLRYEWDRGSEYELDTRLPVALEALIPEEELLHPDHRLFQIVHLITEYGWVALHHTLCDVDAALRAGRLPAAARSLERATQLADIPVNCVRLMADTLPQAAFLRLRERIPVSPSGLDSPGTRSLRKAGAAVWEAFDAAVRDHGLTLAQVALAAEPESPENSRAGDHAHLVDILLLLGRLDSRVMDWRQVHMTMIWKLLGGHPAAAHDSAGEDADRPMSMRGRPLANLERLAVRPLFAALWELSSEVYREMTGPSATGSY